MLLFNVILKSNLVDDNGLEVFHNVLVIFYKNTSVMEIRLDVVPNKFKSSKITGEFNNFTIESTLSWLEAILGLDIEYIDLESITNFIREYKQDEVEVAGQEMINKNNAKSSYSSYIKNGKHILPVIDELKMFTRDNEALLNKIPELKNNFDTFIKEIETTSIYPRTTFCWKDKNVDFLVEFTHNYQGRGYTLLRYMRGIKRMEDMVYVTEYLIKCREDSKESEDNK